MLFRERHGVTNGPGPIRDDQERQFTPRDTCYRLERVILLHRGP